MNKDYSDKHSFIVCAYKESQYLDNCIQSLKEQTVQSTIKVYTSTPNDYIKAIADKYKLDIHTGVGGSIGKDWNNALACATTQYVTIAHQDDIYLPSYAEKMMQEFSHAEDTLISFTNYQEMKEDAPIEQGLNLKIKNILLSPIRYFSRSIWIRNRSLSLGNGICCPAVSYNLHQLNGFKFDEEMRVSLDWEAWYRISQMKGRFGYCSEKLMYHRIHDESETTNMIQDNTRTKEDLYMFGKYWPQPIAKLLMRFYTQSQKSNSV